MITRKNINNLNIWAKLEIYSDYMIARLAMKHDTHVRDVIDKPDNKGWGEPDFVHGNLEYRKLWKDMKIMSFEDFITEPGAPYQEDYLPMWEHYWRFKNRIALDIDKHMTLIEKVRALGYDCNMPVIKNPKAKPKDREFYTDVQVWSFNKDHYFIRTTDETCSLIGRPHSELRRRR